MSEPVSKTTNATILIVDDNAKTADLYTDFLSEYEVDTAYSGQEALELLDETVDVVLLDRLMPTMTGDDVLNEVRARDLDCRVVMVTAVEPDVDILDLPFDDYLVKPVSRNQIRDVVSRMLARSARDEAFQEMFAVVSKMATIESKMSLAEIEASSEYAALESAFAELRAEAGPDRPGESLYAEFADEKIRSLLD